MKNKYFKNSINSVKKKNNSGIDKNDIIFLFSEEAPAPLSLTDIKHHFKIGSHKELVNLRAILDQMVKNGDLIFTKSEKYANPEKLHLIEGEVLSEKSNYSFVRDLSGGTDIYVKNNDMMGALPKDIVILRIVPDNAHYLRKKQAAGRKGIKDRRGTVIRIIKRQLKSFPAVVKLERNIAVLTPVSSDFIDTFYFDLHHYKDKSRLKNGTIVNALLPETDDLSSRFAVIKQIIGDINDSGTEEKIIINKYDLYETFSEEALKEAEKIKLDFMPAERRIDLTALPFITIDGQDAKDFDDAVYLTEPGNPAAFYKLYVAIADVSHFVKQNSKLDEEALKRGNSTYFPNKVYPMLPERLSNDLCSLLPQKNKYVMVCEMNFDKTGKILDTKIYAGVIKTLMRLTYTEVYGFLTGIEKNRDYYCYGGNPKTVRYESTGESKLLPVKDMLIKMRKFAKILRQRRFKNGSLDFDPVSSKVILDENGDISGIVSEEQNFSHELIEDFMIAANCAVAGFIESRNLPSIYRVHERPDEEKVKDFLKIVKFFGYSFSIDSLDTSKDYQQMLEKLKGTELSPFLEQVFLRSMKIAAYSETNIRHFGLAVKSYTHFTSPIRRYADLLVHRILKKILYDKDQGQKGGETGYSAETLKTLANFISRRERLSTEAEREYTEFKKMQFLKKNGSVIYDGYITNVTNFGFFVEITGYFIQGFIHVSTIADDYYEYHDNTKTLKGRHTKRVFKIGEKVNISIYSIDLLKHEIDLRLLSI